MRIVAHNGARIWGGAERATVALLKGLSERGHDVLLLCNERVVADQASARGVQTQICVVGGDIAFHDVFRLARVLKREHPDVFIVGTFKKLFLASLAAKVAKVPRVVARIGLESDIPRNFKYRFALRRWTDGVVVNARRISRGFAGLRGFDDDKVCVIPNFVLGTQSKRSMTVRRELGISNEQFVIGTVARLARQKRIDRLLEAASLLPDVHCIVAGDGDMRPMLEARVRELGISSRAHLLGNRDDVRDVIDSLDVFVVASDSEGMSNAMLEAMERGVPVVSTDVSGADDALAPDESGRAAGVITDFDAPAIARELKRLAGDAALLRSLGDHARAHAHARFSRDASLSAWESFLRTR